MVVSVFGSNNMDLVVRTPRFPDISETISGHEFYTAPGGKGANQAVATVRLGIPTHMIGRVGNDSYGQELCKHLEQTGIDITSVFIDPKVSSGVAIIAVNDAAQNCIIIVPGANGRVAQGDIDRLKGKLSETKVILLQLEIPLETSIAAAQLGKQKGVTVILDPAPACDLPDELYSLLDIITPNEVEASQLVGFPVQTIKDAERAADVLLNRGVSTAIIKMGALGVFYATQNNSAPKDREYLPAYNVNALDTVAAGDAFNGGLAAALVEGHSLSEAVRWGAAAGALSTTKHGVQPPMPSRTEFKTFLQEQNVQIV